MATHSSILAWRIPWTEEPGGLQSKGSQLTLPLFTFTYVARCSSLKFPIQFTAHVKLIKLKLNNSENYRI